jgi:peptidoglycan/xylan/chitin deacetylase (PgdA/CDA1 family)
LPYEQESYQRACKKLKRQEVREAPLKTAAKKTIKSALIYSRVPRLVARGLATRVAVLRYHSILDERSRYANTIGSGIIHSTKTFRAHMEILAREYHPITMDDLLMFLTGQKDLHRRSVIVTFDDGYADNCEIAVPILDHYGITAAFYVGVNPVDTSAVPWFSRLRQAFSISRRETVFDLKEQRELPIKEPADRYAAFQSAAGHCACFIGSKQEIVVREIERHLEVVPLAGKDCPMMTWDQVREVRRHGHTVGSHTVTHPNMAHVSAEDLQHELVESKSKLEQMLGEPILHFSYPSPILEPHYTAETILACAQAGYLTAMTCTPGGVRAGQDPLAIPRIHSDCDEIQFRWNLEWTFLGGRP